jgi:hypothetical protein
MLLRLGTYPSNTAMYTMDMTEAYSQGYGRYKQHIHGMLHVYPYFPSPARIICMSLGYTG